ncbi:MAG: hypothetical protein UY40_C0012G0003 [candidate division CPR1 bacterium GW2011_GWC1_49_13]|uniref:Mur ligase central domain-containing protein n=1 Tax=candidate division CPR1 bacterium GW2011_GWC1_49_13 TaxID=1618342 RepID=A0A0G1VGW5_9BACT|nr:MAG: hypothetical protein UY40_C0012G0003 [candidate division CPR1 bacterium GW2011_GWC1_49_13]
MILHNLLRVLLKAKLKILSRATLKKHRPTVIAVVGEGKTGIAREAIYTVLKEQYPTRRNLEYPFADFALPLTILGVRSYPTNYGQWLKILIKAAFQLLFLPSHKNFLVLEVGYVHKPTFDYFWQITQPQVLVICGPAPYLSSSQTAPQVIKVKEPASLQNYLTAAQKVGRIFGISLKDSQKSLAHFRLPQARIRIIPSQLGGVIVDATYQYFPPDKKAVEEILKALPGKRIEISPQNLSAGIEKAKEKEGQTIVLTGPYVKMWPTLTALARDPWS